MGHVMADSSLRRTGGSGLRPLPVLRRDRHGRGPRGPLLPPQVPGFRTRGELFDAAVLDALADMGPRWPGDLPNIEIAVDEVPPPARGEMLSTSDAVRDGPVVLTRFLPPGVDGRGRATKARIVLYRRPIEMRCPTSADLADLVTELLTEQLTAVLGDGEA